MQTDEFWALIEESRAAMDPDRRDGNMDRQRNSLVARLSRRTPDEIIAYRDHFDFFMNRAYDYDLWAVAYIMGQGCSDDWFDYFCAWLISLGRQHYEAALHDPQSVPAILKRTRAEDIFFEQFTYAAGDAYRKVTGKRLPDSTRRSEPAFTGTNWSDDSELERRFPALWQRYMGT